MTTDTSTTDSGVTRRSMLGILGAAGSLGVLAACAPGGGSKNKGDTGSTKFGFTGWSLNEASTKDTLNSLVDSWAGSHKATLTKLSYPYNNYLSQLTLKMNGGELSGVVQMDIAWLGSIAALGKLTDLGSVAGKNGYTPAALSSGQVKGKQYGLPWSTASIGLTANQDYLDKVGVKTMPTTIEDFESLLKELKGLRIIPYAASTKVTQLKDIEPWIWTFGGSIIQDGKVTLGDEGSVAAVTFYKKLYDQKLIAADVDRFDARALFAQKKAAIYEDAISGRSAVAAASSDKQLAGKVTPFARPVVKASDEPQALLWGHALVVLAGTGSEKATELATWLTSDTPTITTWFSKASLPPATTKGLALPQVAGDKFVSTWSDTITKTAKPGPFWGYTKGAQMDTALATQVQAVLTGQTSPKKAMDQAASDIKALLD